MVGLKALSTRVLINYIAEEQRAGVHPSYWRVFREENFMPTLPFQADSIADLFVRRLGKTPDLVAVSIEGEEATYGEVASLEERIRAAFLHHGIVTGDRVASV